MWGILPGRAFARRAPEGGILVRGWRRCRPGRRLVGAAFSAGGRRAGRRRGHKKVVISLREMSAPALPARSAIKPHKNLDQVPEFHDRLIVLTVARPNAASSNAESAQECVKIITRSVMTTVSVLGSGTRLCLPARTAGLLTRSERSARQ